MEVHEDSDHKDQSKRFPLKYRIVPYLILPSSPFLLGGAIVIARLVRAQTYPMRWFLTISILFGVVLAFDFWLAIDTCPVCHRRYLLRKIGSDLTRKHPFLHPIALYRHNGRCACGYTFMRANSKIG